jgi:hypothetical protein
MQCVPQDWLDIDFAIKEDIDFIAVSFVKSADVIKNLKSYLNARATKARTHHEAFRGNNVLPWLNSIAYGVIL